VEWINPLRGCLVGLDTAPLIYFIEQDLTRSSRLKPLFAAAERGEFRLVTSYVTLLEVLVHPLRNDRKDLAQKYRDILLNSASLVCLPLNAEIAEEAARLRATHNLRTPDAIQVATARSAGASWFITNDVALSALPHLSVVIVDRLSSEQSV
jgi:predicted nucleic acid-binding protein